VGTEATKKINGAHATGLRGDGVSACTSS
jgi:hypothetical protein